LEPTHSGTLSWLLAKLSRFFPSSDFSFLARFISCLAQIALFHSLGHTQMATRRCRSDSNSVDLADRYRSGLPFIKYRFTIIRIGAVLNFSIIGHI
jgi:hypothetical protein